MIDPYQMEFSNCGNENHEVMPSCSYKLEVEENVDSCDSGISMSSNFSCAGNFPTDFTSLKAKSVELDGFFLLNKSLRDLSDEELEAEKSLQKRLNNDSKRSRGLFDVTNKLQDSPKSRNFFARKDDEDVSICRKRSAINYRTHSENFKKRKKSDAEVNMEEENVAPPPRCILRRSQSTIETHRVEIPLSPGYQQGSDGVAAGYAFRNIDGSTLINWMASEDFFEKYLLIDCRYPYEYNGGHIKGAVNCYNPDTVESIFYSKDKEPKVLTKTPIFYCEFSQVRGPKMAQRLRSFDRECNIERYPELDYKEICILKEGYRTFYSLEERREYCEPQAYIEMKNGAYTQELKKYELHKSKSFSGTSGRHSLRSKYARSRIQAFERPSLFSPSVLKNYIFEEKTEEEAYLTDGVSQIITTETTHFARLQMASPSPRSLPRPPTRRAVFPPQPTKGCIVKAELEVSLIGASATTSQPDSPSATPRKEDEETAPASPVIDFDSDPTFTANDGSPVPNYNSNIMPLPVPQFS